MSERQGVEIDYCPECRGIWLDRGELDKILDGIGAGVADAQGPQLNNRDRRDSAEAARRKKSSPFEFLGDIFGG